MGRQKRFLHVYKTRYCDVKLNLLMNSDLDDNTKHKLRRLKFSAGDLERILKAVKQVKGYKDVKEVTVTENNLEFSLW